MTVLAVVRWCGLPLAVGVALLLAVAGGAQKPAGPMMASYVNPDDSLPHLRFPDGRISLNDRCMVRQVKLNVKMPPIYVGGEPVGFC